jgi:hypothetical protein
MNEYELLELSYNKIIELHDQPNLNPRIDDIAFASEVLVETSASGGSKTTFSIIAYRIVAIHSDTKRLHICSIRKYFPDGTSESYTKEKLVDATYFSQSITENIADDKQWLPKL